MARSATILVVEDDADVREIAVGYISALGYSVLSACDGDEALSILEGNTPIDLLLTDIVMPGLDGITLGRRAIAPTDGGDGPDRYAAFARVRSTRRAQ